MSTVLIISITFVATVIFCCIIYNQFIKDEPEDFEIRYAQSKVKEIELELGKHIAFLSQPEVDEQEMVKDLRDDMENATKPYKEMYRIFQERKRQLQSN